MLQEHLAQHQARGKLKWIGHKIKILKKLQLCAHADFPHYGRLLLHAFQTNLKLLGFLLIPETFAPVDIPGIHTLPLISLGVIPRPTASNTMDPSDIISLAHSVVVENWKQSPAQAKSSQNSIFLLILQCLENKNSSFLKSQMSQINNS